MLHPETYLSEGLGHLDLMRLIIVVHVHHDATIDEPLNIRFEISRDA